MREIFTFAGILGGAFLLGGIGWYWYHGQGFISAYLIASSVCFFFGLVALAVQQIGVWAGNMMAGTQGSIAVRTLGPLAVGVFVMVNESSMTRNLIEHRFFIAFVGSYLLTLAVETILSVRLMNRWERLRNQGGPLPDDSSSEK